MFVNHVAENNKGNLVNVFFLRKDEEPFHLCSSIELGLGKERSPRRQLETKMEVGKELSRLT